MSEPPPELALLLDHLAYSPVMAQQIHVWTARHTHTHIEPHSTAIQQGWPKECSPELETFYQKRHELSSLDGCILWVYHSELGVVQEQPEDEIFPSLSTGIQANGDAETIAEVVTETTEETPQSRVDMPRAQEALRTEKHVHRPPDRYEPGFS